MSRLQKYILNEKFFMSKKLIEHGKEKYIEIWVNPTKAKTKKIAKDVRFIADSDSEKVYVWDAYIATHDFVWNKMLKKELHDNRKYTLRKGYKEETLLFAGAKNGDFEDPDEWASFTHEDLDEVFYGSGDYWLWLEKYFSGIREMAEYAQMHSHR